MQTAICKTCGKQFRYYTSRSSGQYCSHTCASLSPAFRAADRSAHLGRKHTLDARRKMSVAHKGTKQTPEWVAKRFKAFKKTWDHRGRVTNEYLRFRVDPLYLAWRQRVVERDKFTCQSCGDKRGHNLSAHHIIPMRCLWEEYKIGACDKRALLDLDNGVTLCTKCHKQTKSFLRRAATQPELILLNLLKRQWELKGKHGTFGDFYIKKMGLFIQEVIRKTSVKEE